MSNEQKRMVESDKALAIKRAARAVHSVVRATAVETTVRLDPTKLPPKINMRDWRMAARARRERAEREERNRK